jgi:hypothetical protein
MPDILSAVPAVSGVKLRWAHRLESLLFPGALPARNTIASLCAQRAFCRLIVIERENKNAKRISA